MLNRQLKSPHSITALSVAQGVLSCAKNEEWTHLVNPESADLLEYFVNYALQNYPYSLGWATLKILSFFPYKAQMKLLQEHGTDRGYPQHCAMRKLFIEQQVEQAIKNGYEQVIVLGGGYDTLALRLHLHHENVYFFELDRGHTCDTKQFALEQLRIIHQNNKTLINSTEKINMLANRYGKIDKNLYFIESDLSTSNWYENLILCPDFDNKKNTIVVIEGLTMYLTKQEVRDLLSTLNKCILNENAKIIISFADALPTTAISQTLRNETNELYQCAVDKKNVPEFVSQDGFMVLGKALGINFQIQAENADENSSIINYASSNENYYIIAPIKNTNHQFFMNDITVVPDMKVDIPSKKILINTGYFFNIV